MILSAAAAVMAVALFVTWRVTVRRAVLRAVPPVVAGTHSRRVAVAAPQADLVLPVDAHPPAGAGAADGADAKGNGKPETDQDALHGVLLS